jgi:hypothetical protein
MRLLKLALAALLLAGQALPGFAQTYPITTPVYIPSAIEQPAVCIAACDVVFTVSGVSTVTLQLVGTPAAITASVQGTNEAQSVAAPTWTALNMIPVNGGSAVTSTSAVGFWTVNTTGLTKVRAHVSALTGSVTVNMTGSSGGTVSFSSNSVVLADVEANIAPGTAPAKAAIVGGVYNSALPTATNGQTVAIQLNASGEQLVASPNLEMAIAPGTAPAKALAVGGVYNSALPTATNGQTVAIQLNASGEQLVASPNLEMAIAPGTAPAKALAAGGVYNSAAPTLTNGQTAALQLNASGQLITSTTNTEGVITAATAPTKMQVSGAVYNSSPPSLSTGQSAALQLDNDGSLYMNLRDDTVVAADPCQSRNVAKSSVLSNIGSATTTALVAVSGVKAIYVCGISIVTGAADTVYLEYGTSTNCTGTTALTPTYIASSQINIGWGGGTVVTAPASQGLCAVSTGTNAQQVLVSYVQQ